MRRRWLPALVGLWLVIGSGSLRAQSTTALEERPGLVTMRFFQCGIGAVNEAIGVLSGQWRRIALQLVGEGLLLDYQILQREWGDEWNLVDYYVATDMDAFTFAFEELQLRYRVADAMGADAQRFATLCPRRKDAVYAVVPSPE